MAATLKDVAELAGVSVATVSRVLNDPSKVAENSRNKVLNAVEKLGYSSNLLAKSLRQDGLNAVYVLLPNFTDPFFSQIHQGISDVLASYGYMMVSAATEDDPEIEKEYLLKAKAIGPSGILMYTFQKEIPSSWDAFAEDTFILFLSGNIIKGHERMAALSLHREEQGEKAALYLAEQGGMDLIYMCSNPEGIESECMQGALKGAKAAGINCELCRCGRSVEDAKREIEVFLSTMKPVDSILAQSALQAAGALEALKAAHTSVPEQVRILSLENTNTAILTSPQLSVFGPSGYQIGMTGAKQLLDWILAEKKGGQLWQGEIDQKLIVRGSTDERA